ncbi:MAG: hypothetical protein Q7K25_06900 [Actinomycetota bacterium]|nr:hypothetical protein [Actinomycetota bacterium]
MPPAPLTLRCADLELSVDVAAGGRATALRFEGVELLGGRTDDPVEHGMYAMGPWAGRLHENQLRLDGRQWPMPVNYQGWALHGTVLERPWVVLGLAQEADHAWLAITTDLGQAWPWRGSMELTWSLHRSVVRTRVSVRAHDSEFPAVIGMHPWFRKRTEFGQATWELPGGEIATKDAHYALTGQLQSPPERPGAFDDSFRVLDRRARVSWGTELTLDIHQSHSWFVVYDADRDYLCIEPQTGPPNGINPGPFGPVTMVSPGTPLSQQTAWTFNRGQRADPASLELN